MSRSQYMRDVVLVQERSGPRGGRVLVLTMACGHLIWRNARKGALPPQSLECLPCWARANPGRPT